MGRNHRYGSDVQDATLARINRPGPDSLHRAETGDDYRQAPDPIPVRAWVRFGQEPARVDALAIGWTSRAVSITFAHDGGSWRAWVWASAVERR